MIKKLKSINKKTVTVSSSSWTFIEFAAVCNGEHEIKISKRMWNRKANCYVKNINVKLTQKSAERLYKLLQHLNNDCDEEKCSLCKEFREKYF